MTEPLLREQIFSVTFSLLLVTSMAIAGIGTGAIAGTAEAASVSVLWSTAPPSNVDQSDTFTVSVTGQDGGRSSSVCLFELDPIFDDELQCKDTSGGGDFFASFDVDVADLETNNDDGDSEYKFEVRVSHGHFWSSHSDQTSEETVSVDSGASSTSIDNTAPSIESWSAEKDGRHIDVTATVSDDQSGVDEVEVTWDKGLTHFGTTNQLEHTFGDQYELTIPTSGEFPSGEDIQVKITATDNNGNSRTTDTRTVTVAENDPPVVDWSTDVDERTVTVSATVTDSTDRIDSVTVFWDTGLGDFGGYSARMNHEGGDSYELTIPANGQFDWGEDVQVKIRATDTTGRSTTTNIRTVETPDDLNPPSIDWTATTNGDGTVTVRATVTDSRSGVDSVTAIWDTGFADVGGTSARMNHVGGDTYEVTVPGNGMFDGGEDIQVKVRATDEAGNSETTDIRTVQTAERIDATIVDFSGLDSGEFGTGETVSAQVTVKNVGNTEHGFFVGFSVNGPNGNFWDNRGTTHEKVTLTPGEVKTVTVEWTVEPNAPSGSYGAVTAVWKEEENGLLHGRLDRRRTSQAFDVTQKTVAVAMEGTIEGKVTYLDGEPVENAQIVATRSPVHGTISTTQFVVRANKNGEYELPVTPGRYTIVAHKKIDGKSYSSPPTTVTIDEDGTVGQRLTLQKIDSLNDEVKEVLEKILRRSYVKYLKLALTSGRLPVPIVIYPGDEYVPDILEPDKYGSFDEQETVTVAYATKEPVYTRTSASPREDYKEVSARIINFETPKGTYQYGDTVSASVEVENTGNTEQTFFVDFIGIGPQGTQHDNDGSTQRRVSIAPGQRRTVSVSWTVKEGIPQGDYSLVTAVWMESDPDNHQTALATANEENVIEVRTEDASPTAEANGPYSVSPGGSVALESSGSTDPDGSIRSSTWEVVAGPGSVVDGTYHAPESVSSETTATVQLTVTDEQGATATDTATVTVTESTHPPSATVTHSPSSPTVGEPVSIDASDSSDPNGDIRSYEWDLDGDGAFDDASGPTAEQTFQTAGTYTVSVSVTDDAGNRATASESITVESTSDTASLEIRDATASSNGDATIRIELTNRGDDAGFIVNLSLPAGLTVVSQSADGGTWDADETKWIWQTVESGSSATPTVTVALPADAAESYRISGEVLAVEGVVDTAMASVRTTRSVPGVVDDDGDGKIGDREILQAIEYWRRDAEVPDTGGKTVGDVEILELIEMWRNDTDVDQR